MSDWRTFEAEVLSRLALLAEDVHALRAALERDRPGRPPEPNIAGLLRAIVAALGRDFTVAELFEHAEVDPPLRAGVVSAVGALNPHKLGRLFSKIEGRVYDGLSVHRIGTTAHAGRWAVVEVGRSGV